MYLNELYIHLNFQVYIIIARALIVIAEHN